MAPTKVKLSSINPMSRLYQRLASSGLDRSFVKKRALPEWWEDEVGKNPAGYAQAITIISRNLGLDLSSLQDDSRPVITRDFGPTKFKKRQSLSKDALRWPKCISARAAQLACLATPIPISDVPTSGSEIRQAILSSGARWVDLDSLLDYCWSLGIPVLHLPEFPSGTNKMDGLSVKIEGRPAIVISNNRKFSAWLLFILAHELGHIARGHFQGDGIVVDETVRRDVATNDPEELEAKQFAMELLTGHPNRDYNSKNSLNALNLAVGARRTGSRQSVDPGFIALNYAWTRGRFPVGMAALAKLEPRADAATKIRSVMIDKLEWGRLTDESADFLMRITTPS